MINGIKSVDFFIKATGEGVINHNGAISVYNPSAKAYIDNHLFPKLRGLDPMRKIANDEKTKGLSLGDPELGNAVLIVSANCIRSHIFKNVSFGIQDVTRATAGDALASLHGLVRGYLITDGGANFARKSALYLTDFECKNPQLTYNQASKAGARSETSIFSYFNTGSNLEYSAKGSLSIEDLQFIPLENSLGRSSYSEAISEEEGTLIATHITEYLCDLSGNKLVEATFVNNAIRKGSFAQNGEAGILLNTHAIDVIVKEIIDMISSLYIRQGKGYLRVTDVVVDYNTGQTLRAENDFSKAQEKNNQEYALYYNVNPLPTQTFNDKMLALKAQSKEKEKKKTEKKSKSVE